MFGKKKLDGENLIGDALSIFEDVSKKLDDGIALCDTEEAEINAEIETLDKRKSSILAIREKAKTVQRNIGQIFK